MVVISGDKYERVPDDWEAMKYNGNNAANVKAWCDQYKAGALIANSDGSLVFHPDAVQSVVDTPVGQGTFVLVNLTTLDVSLVDKDQVGKWRKKP